MLTRKAKAFWPLLMLLVLADCGTKRLAEEHLQPQHVPHDIVGDVLRFTLAYNPGAAFSFSLGDYSRVGFTLLALIVLAVLAQIYRTTSPQDRIQPLALALIAGGAVGNVLDRLRSERGVVDFIDIGYGSYRFYTFNIADMGITFGAVLLAILIWRRDDAQQQQSDAPA